MANDRASRWAYWLPIASMASQRAFYSGGRAAMMEEFRRRHASALDSCILAGLSWRVIIRHALDDPRVSPEVRQVNIRAAAERSRTRTPHRKRIKKEHYAIERNGTE